jgi:hypothetical protein
MVTMETRAVQMECADGTPSWAQSIKGTERLLDLPIEELLSRFSTSQSGLSSQDAKYRLEICGYN